MRMTTPLPGRFGASTAGKCDDALTLVGPWRPGTCFLVVNLGVSRNAPPQEKAATSRTSRWWASRAARSWWRSWHRVTSTCSSSPRPGWVTLACWASDSAANSRPLLNGSAIHCRWEPPNQSGCATQRIPPGAPPLRVPPVAALLIAERLQDLGLPPRGRLLQKNARQLDFALLDGAGPSRRAAPRPDRRGRSARPAGRDPRSCARSRCWAPSARARRRRLGLAASCGSCRWPARRARTCCSRG